MKVFDRAKFAPAFALFGVATLLVSPLAQPGTYAQGMPGGGPGMPGGFGGGQFNQRPPFAFGTVTAVDSGAGTITINSQMGSQTIQTGGTAKIVTQSAATVADLKVGDQVQIQGVPTGITASALTIGQSPFAPPAPPPGGRGGNAGGPDGPGGGPMQSFAVATGTVASTSPLTITLSSSATLTLKMDASAKVTKFASIDLSSVKVGDRVMSTGQSGADGTFTATTVGVNMNMGGMGMGMGRRGQGGPNGRGMGGPGGGFGGPGGGGFGGPNARTFGGPGGGGNPQGFGGPGGGGPGGPPPDGGMGGPPPPDGGPGGPPPNGG